MIKITNKNTKQELANFLEEVLDSPKYTLEDKSLVDMATYTIKKFSENAKEVVKADIVDVATELQEYITPKQVVLVENKIKTIKKEEPTKETKEVKTPLKIEPKEPKEEPKAKKETKKVTKKEKTVEKVESFKFPKSIETEDSKLILIDEGLESIDLLDKAINDDGRKFQLAVVWTKKDLKLFQYGYDDKYRDIKSFPNDLDMYLPTYIADDGKSMYALSIHTELMVRFDEEHFELLEGIRYSYGAEWGLYEEFLNEELEVMNEVDEESVKELEEEEAKEDTK